MQVYDIIQTVRPGAPTSLPPGEFWIESYDDPGISEFRAQTYNRCACAGVSYSVEPIEELAENRKLPRK